LSSTWSWLTSLPLCPTFSIIQTEFLLLFVLSLLWKVKLSPLFVLIINLIGLINILDLINYSCPGVIIIELSIPILLLALFVRLVYEVVEESWLILFFITSLAPESNCNYFINWLIMVYCLLLKSNDLFSKFLELSLILLVGVSILSRVFLARTPYESFVLFSKHLNIL